MLLSYRLHLLTIILYAKVVSNSYIWLEQISRQEVLQMGCDKLAPIKVHYSELDHMLVNHQHKLLYCYVPKVACTNWKRVLMALSNYKNVTDLTSIPASLAHANGSLLKLPELDEYTAKALLRNFTSFIMVRHPFERLLSAYRNKLEDNKPSAQYFQSRIGKYIIRKYRKDPKPEDIETGHNVSFQEFVRYLINEGVVNDDINEHWKPIYKLCYPCSLNYSFIGKYEKFEDDAKVLLKLIEAPTNITFPHTKSSQTSNKLKYYFQQLSLKEIEQLYRLYENDFKLFGYDLESILGFDIG